MLGESRIRAAVDGTEDDAAAAPRGLRRRLSAAMRPGCGPAGAARPAAPGGTRSRGRSRRWCSARTSSSRCSGCCSSTPGSYDLGIYTEYVKQLSQLHAPVVDVLGAGIQPARQPLPGRGRRDRPVLPARSPRRRRCCSSRRWRPRCRSSPWSTAGFALTGRSDGPADRLRVRLLLGPAADDRLRLPRDRPRRAAARVLAVSALVRRRPVAAIAWAVPLVFVKEDQGFTVAAIGLLLGATMAFRPVAARRLWRGATRTASRRGAGCSSSAWGLFWSVFAIIVIIPHFNPAPSVLLLGGRRRGRRRAAVLRRRAARPGGRRLAHQAGRRSCCSCCPRRSPPLGSPVALIALPSLALRFMSTNTAYWGTACHYNATVMPILFIAAAEAIGRWRRASALAWPPDAGSGAAPPWPGAPRPGLDAIRGLAARARDWSARRRAASAGTAGR